MQAQPQGQMSRTGSRLVIGCVTAVSIPFILAGLVTVKDGIGRLGHDEGAWMAVGAGALFAGLGILFIAGVSYGMRHLAHEATMHDQNPDRPWLWRDDWALGYAREANSASMLAIWTFAIVWNIVTLPLVLVVRREYESGNTKMLFATIFPIAGVVLLFVAIYQTFRQQRYGKTVCHFEGVPLGIGHVMRGDVELKSDVQPERGFVMRLACVRAVTKGRRRRSTTESVLWDEEQVVGASGVMRSPAGLRVPFDFVTPPDAPTTDMRNGMDRTFWRLSIHADVPGVDLDASYLLPLFAVGGTVADSREFVSYAEAHRAASAQRELGPRSGVTITKLADGGSELVVRSNPTFGGFFGVALFLTLWNGVIYLMVHLEAPVAFPIVFGLFDFLIVYGLLDYLFGRSKIQANREGLRYGRSIIGGGSMKYVAAEEVEVVRGHADNQNRNFSVEIKQCGDGSRSDIARFLRSRGEADTVAAKIEEALGPQRRRASSKSARRAKDEEEEGEA